MFRRIAIVKNQTNRYGKIFIRYISRRDKRWKR